MMRCCCHLLFTLTASSPFCFTLDRSQDILMMLPFHLNIRWLQIFFHSFLALVVFPGKDGRREEGQEVVSSVGWFFSLLLFHHSWSFFSIKLFWTTESRCCGLLLCCECCCFVFLFNLKKWHSQFFKKKSTLKI